ncbi:hypothetical protein AHF37_02290 [Paragonimus kellicotti]|nr:hypothetical protein AHF37_02290 [Paragonimus kellicotti]
MQSVFSQSSATKTFICSTFFELSTVSHSYKKIVFPADATLVANGSRPLCFSFSVVQTFLLSGYLKQPPAETQENLLECNVCHFTIYLSKLYSFSRGPVTHLCMFSYPFRLIFWSILAKDACCLHAFSLSCLLIFTFLHHF